MAKTCQPIFFFLHAFALSGLALAQPLFDLLARYPEFLVAHRVGGAGLLLAVLVLSLGLPALLAGLGWLLQAWSDALCRIWSRFWIGLLAACFFLQLLKRTGDVLPGAGIVAVAVFLGFGLALAYGRWTAIRSFLTILAVAAVVFPTYFLLATPAGRLLSGGEADPLKIQGKVQRPVVGTRAPVVMVVFDELPLLSLMDSRGKIDAGRFPHFAALAGESYWFPNATTVSEGTLLSLPAILDGLYPTPERPRLPNFRDHPRSLFTLLEGSHELHVYENITQLAPPGQRLQVGLDAQRRLEPRLFLGDLALLYAHLALPLDLARHLPPVTESWKGFGALGEAGEGGEAQRWESFQADWAERRQQFERFLAAIQLAERPGFYFLHSMLPHASWKYLPDGRLYTVYEKPGVRGVLGPNDRGKDVNWWLNDPWIVLQGHQRHLLQVGFVDTLLGQLVARLREIGIYDECLLVVTSDHGTAFLPDDSRREITESNYPAILSIPLLIKAPGQREGRMIERNVESIDILPTVAELLGVSLPWTVDGRSAVAEQWPERTRITAFADKGRKFSFPAGPQALRTFLARRIGRLGEKTWEAVFRIGDERLLHRQVSLLPTAQPAPERVELAEAAFFSRVDPGGPFVPARISGRILGGEGGREAVRKLAVAVNGRVEAVTRTSLAVEDNREFSALVRPAAFRPGANRVEVFLIGEGDVLRRLPQRLEDFRLETGPDRLVSSRKRVFPVEPGRLVGWVVGGLDATQGRAYVGGWAADRQLLRPADAVLVFLGERLLAGGAPRLPRADSVQFLKTAQVRDSGFMIEFPLEALPADLTRASIRVFGLSRDGRASELNYPGPGERAWAFARPAVTPAAAAPAPSKPHAAAAPDDLIVRFSETSPPIRFVSGWGAHEKTHIWTTATIAEFELQPPPQAGPLVLELSLQAFLPPQLSSQRVLLRSRGKLLGEWRLTEAGKQTLRVDLPAGSEDGSDWLLFRLELPDSVSPAELGVSPDRRRLGIALSGAALGPAR